MILVNGRPADEVSALDRGLAYGDGVFRTFPARAGAALHWGRQYAKLAADCEALRIRAPAEALLAAEVKTACAGIADAVVKIVVTRGAGRRGYAYDAGTVPTRIVVAEAASGRHEAARAAGVRVRLCTTRLAHQPALAGVKHLNRLENVLARAEWDDPGIAEVLMADVEGNMIAGTMTNLFMVLDGVLATPRLDLCGVAGVTRARVLEAAGRLAIPCAVMPCTHKDLMRSKEVFVVNSLAGIWPVCELDGVPLEAGSVTRALQAALREEDDVALR